MAPKDLIGKDIIRRLKYQDEVLIENYDLQWNKSAECGMLFKYVDLAWHGIL